MDPQRVTQSQNQPKSEPEISQTKGSDIAQDSSLVTDDSLQGSLIIDLDRSDTEIAHAQPKVIEGHKTQTSTEGTESSKVLFC